MPTLTRDIFNRVRRAAKHLSPGHRRARASTQAERDEFELMLCRIVDDVSARVAGKVLIDATYDNPNYWLRLTFLRAALGLPHTREIGLLGPYRRQESARTLARLGIDATLDACPSETEHRRGTAEARRLLQPLSEAEQLLTLDLPFGFPACMIYDKILKVQRSAVANLRDHRTRDVLADGLATLYAADRIVTEDLSLVALSHCQGLPYSPLAWVAALKEIPVVNVAAGYGSLHFTRLTAPNDLFRTTSRPLRSDFAQMSAEQITALEATGRSYLYARFAGQTGDLGAVYAYDVNSVRLARAEMIRRLRFDPARPLIIVYASHWFDMPHIHGMRNFRDFLDWIETTVEIAKATPDVNWLFKNHPCESWYGGVTMHDILRDVSAPNLRLAPPDWNSYSTTSAADGIVTYHGTVGIEGAALGKPVLLADHGWYHDQGFARWARSRKEYVRLLGGPWWKDVDTTTTRRNALIFAGLYFAVPDLQGELAFADDALQEQLYIMYRGMLADNARVIECEIATLAEWYASGETYYHIHKMLRVNAYRHPVMPGRAQRR